MIHIPLTTVDSTNEWAKKHWKELDPDGLTIVTAQEQTAGRGQWGRTWVSPAGGNLYVSYCSFVPEESDLLLQPRWLADAVCEVLAQHGASLVWRWPNDLLFEGKKCGGILSESSPKEGCLLVIHGLGLNLWNHPLVFPDERSQPVTHLEAEGIRTPPALTLAIEIAECFLRRHPL